MDQNKINEIKTLLLENNQESIKEFVSHFQPFDIAEMLVELDHEEQLVLISILPIELGAEILEYLEPELQYKVLHRIKDNFTSLLLNEMSSDTIVNLLLSIHPHQAKKLMEFLPEDYRKKIDTLMKYEPDTAGRLATVDYIAARINWTVDQTLQHIRKVGQEAEIVSYIYVVGSRGELVGVVSLKEIILAKSGTKLEEIIQGDPISVSVDMDQQDAAEILSKYDLVAIPVVAQDHRMIGILTVDDLIDVIHEEATEDFQKLGGSQPLDEPYFKNSIWNLYRKRIGWLLVLFIAEAYTGTVLRHYEDTLSKQIALSFFVPLLIGTGGNTGSQTVTTLVRALAVGEVQFKDMFKVFRKEVSTGVFLGISMGIVAIIRAFFLGVNIHISSVVAISALFIVIWASMVAAVLPMILHKLKIDPAVVSGPFITTLVDGTGLILYFSMAKLLLHI
ncbi:magnesium transporter [Heyndrickxia shackletonii]|uniref:Magnesium transporter MgtE n=1 Tax=Heyndrickxia shackletonii TaxID=157838 RepID=A0A0Q3WWH3_9BACI|nr:magnesium transporter [Heyndrickxia shackletonii]KQL53151.1 magnesium transporter [Heyndrickxia shackletonii]NEZ00664.1 magnesium transporter [Heyndrickxia shackletonii]